MVTAPTAVCATTYRSPTRSIERGPGRVRMRRATRPVERSTTATGGPTPAGAHAGAPAGRRSAAAAVTRNARLSTDGLRPIVLPRSPAREPQPPVVVHDLDAREALHERGTDLRLRERNLGDRFVREPVAVAFEVLEEPQL